MPHAQRISPFTHLKQSAELIACSHNMKPTQPVTLRGAFLPIIKQQQILIFSEVLTLRFHYAISTLSLEQVAKACCHAKKSNSE